MKKYKKAKKKKEDFLVSKKTRKKGLWVKKHNKKGFKNTS
jgi:hypothetical protein